MKLERISYQYADGTVAAYDFHPRLTVIDVHPAHRRALVEHLVSALTTAAPGVHVEATMDGGPSGAPTSVVAFRPYGAAHRVIDVDRGDDLTARYEPEPGRVDLLRGLPVSGEELIRLLVGSASELVLGDPTDRWIAKLAAHDAEHVLSVAAASAGAERELREATVAAQATPQLAGAVEHAYDSRERASALQKKHRRVQVLTVACGTAAAGSAVAGAATIGNGPALGLVAVPVVLAIGCLRHERKLAKAVEGEYRALDAAGTSSYADLDRLAASTGLDDQAVRARLVNAAERYRSTTATWQDLAGDIPAPWAIAQAERLRASAALRAALQPLPSAASTDGLTSSAALLDGLARRAEAIAERTGGREALPLLLDDPIEGLAWEEKVPVLEVLGRLSERQQLILATDDPDVLGWARLEAIAGTVGVVDVNPGRSAANTASPTSV